MYEHRSRTTAWESGTEKMLTCWSTFAPAAWPLTAICAMGKKGGRGRGALWGTRKTKEGNAGVGMCRAGEWRELEGGGKYCPRMREREMPTAPPASGGSCRTRDDPRRIRRQSRCSGAQSLIISRIQQPRPTRSRLSKNVLKIPGPRCRDRGRQ